MSRISDLYLRIGDAQANQSLARGQGRAATLSALAGFLPSVQKRQQEDADRASVERLQDARLRSEQLQQQDYAGRIEDRNQERMDATAARDMAAKTLKVNNWLADIASNTDLDLQRAAYGAGRAELVTAGILTPNEAPDFFPGMSWVKARMAQTLPATERFKQMFPEATQPEPFTLSEGQTRFGPEGQQIANVPKTVEPPKGPTTIDAAILAAQTRGDATEVQRLLGLKRQMEAAGRAPVQGSSDQIWVVRNGQPIPIRKGTAQSGDLPYEKASANAAQAGPSQYSIERNARTVQSVDELIGKVSRRTAGFGSWLAGIPESDARNFRAELDTLKANIAFNELTEMREASKTGGALGQVSNVELGLLQSALGALDPGQSPENLKQQLLRVKASVQRWQAARGATGAGPGIAPMSSRQGTPAAPRPDPLGIR